MTIDRRRFTLTALAAASSPLAAQDTDALLAELAEMRAEMAAMEARVNALETELEQAYERWTELEQLPS